MGPAEEEAGPAEEDTEAATADPEDPQLDVVRIEGGTAMATSVLKWIAIGIAAAAAILGGCGSDAGGGFGNNGAGFGGGTGGAPSGAPAQPMLVEVDADKTMTAQPGQGVGVFTEYGSGGHWHVWWTCDTYRSGQPCSFQVTVTVASGAIANASGEALEASDELVQPAASEVEVVTRTSTRSDGVRFDTSPGAVITLDAKLNGQDDGSILFFVQDGVVNGDYSGTVTDPLMFEPASP